MTTEFPKRNSVNQDSRRGAAVLVDGTRGEKASMGKHSAPAGAQQQQQQRRVERPNPERRSTPAPHPQSQKQPEAKKQPEGTLSERRAAAMRSRAVSNVRKEKDRGAKVGKFLLTFICAAALFAAGFALRGFEPLMARLNPSLATPAASQIAANALTTYNSLSPRIAEVEKILTDESLDEYNLDAVTAALLQDWATLTNDSYARYFSEDRYAVYVKENTAEYAGIGVLFSEFDGQTYAADVFPDSAAALAGVHQGDYVVAIDGSSTAQWTPSEVINALSRPAGESVVITWKRPNPKGTEEAETFSVNLECKDYKKTNVTAQLSNGSVGYISLSQLSSNAKDLVQNAVTSLAGQGAKSYVLDIRGCSGGYLSQAVDIASLFVKSGVIAQIQTKDGITTRTATGATITDAPLVVLIDDKTSAAAEVLAAGLHDNQRASLVGATSLGKGSVQVVKALTFGGAVRYTAAYYLSPTGHAIEGQGVTPEAVVSDPASQLTVALSLAQSL